MALITCIIIEDEVPAIEELKYLLSKHENIKILGTALDGESGLQMAKKLLPDVVFLDINMPAKNGIEVSKELKEKYDLDIVFITAYEEHAVKAFEIDVIDYVLKPFSEERINKTVTRLQDRFGFKKKNNEDLKKQVKNIIRELHATENTVRKIPCELNGKTILIDVKDICLCFTENEKTYVRTREKQFLTNYMLHELEEKTGFFRAHRSYIVNLNNIKELYPWFHGTYKLIINDDNKTEVPVSRSNVKKMKELLGL